MRKCSKTHYIRLEFLERVVLYEVNRLASFTNEYEDDFIKARYEQEQGENAKRIKALRLELKKSEGKRMDIDTFLATVRRYTNATETLKRMVAELIDRINVYHTKKQDGVTPSTLPFIITVSALSPSLTAGKFRLRRSRWGRERIR